MDSLAHRRRICELAIRENRIEEAVEQLANWVFEMHTELEALTRRLTEPQHFTLTVPNTERNPATMAFQIADDDTSKKLTTTFLDALGFPTTDAGATVAYASSDPAVATIDATSGAITPVAPGTVQGQATVTNADGSSVTGQPADIEIIAGAAKSFTVGVA